MISKKDVEYIANLARISLDKKEKEKFSKDLAKILEYVNKINKLNLEGVSPTSHVVELKSITREDKKIKNLDSDKNLKLLKLVPHLKENYIKTKEILKEK